MFRKWAISTTAFAAISCAATPFYTVAALAQGDAAAAPEGKHLEEMVVTARRRAENIQAVPVAITAVSSDTMRTQNILKFRDLARVVPGLSASGTTRGSYTMGYGIRGQRGAFTQTILLEPAVGVYFAEMNLSRHIGIEQGMFDLESVQVLKGPQGTLFGRNSTGGAILIEPKKPDSEFGGYLQGSFGNYNFRDYEAAINIPITPKVAVRVAGKLTSRDGYAHSVVTGQDLNDLDSSSARVSVRLRPTDAIDSTFIATYFEGKGNGEALRMIAVDTNGISAAARGTLGAIVTSEFAKTQALPKYETRAGQLEGEYDRTRSIQNNTTIDLGATALGELTLKNIAGYKDLVDQQQGLGHNSTSFLVFAYTDTGIHAKQYSEEFQIQGKTEKLDWVVGGYYFQETGTDRFTTKTGDWVLSPELAALGLPAATMNALLATNPSRARNSAEAKNIAYAGFLHTNYKLSSLVEGLSISGGVRWTRDERNVVWHNQSYRGTTPAPTTILCVVTGKTTPFAAGFNEDNCSTSAQKVNSVITYDMGLDYKLNPDTLIYLVSRRGYRSGGFNSTQPNINSLVGAVFDPEFNRDVEVGVKTDFTIGNMVGRLNTAVFYEWYNNVQRNIAGQNADGSFSGRVTNAAVAHIKGGEAELTLKPTEALELQGNFAIVQPNYDSWLDAVRPTTGPAAGTIIPVDVSDSLFSYVPYKQYSVSAKYTFQVPAEWGIPSFLVSWNGLGKMSTQEPDTQNCGPAITGAFYPNCLNQKGRIPGYSLVNLRADWRNVGGHGVDVAAFVTNLMDKYYYNHAVNSIGAGFGYASASLGAPRMFGVEMRVPFGSMAY